MEDVITIATASPLLGMNSQVRVKVKMFVATLLKKSPASRPWFLKNFCFGIFHLKALHGSVPGVRGI